MHRTEASSPTRSLRLADARALAARPARNLSYLSVGAALLCGLLAVVVAVPARAQLFTELGPGLAEKPFACVSVADYDGDGQLDVLVAASGSHDIAFTTLYHNDGGTFTNSGIVLLGLSRATAAWGDFDGDGDLDLAMTGVPTGTTIPVTRVYRNDGKTFTPLPQSFFGEFAGSITWADYDGDGDLDLLVTGDTFASAEGLPATRLYRNDDGVFTPVAHPFPDCYVGSVAWGDFDNDGDLDVVIAGAGGAPLYASIWRNDGFGQFTDIGAGLPGLDLGFTEWGDYDNDGDLDLLFGGNGSLGFITTVYRNDGNGTFTNTNAGMLPVLWASGAWADFDNDGDLDAMVFGYDPVAQVPHSTLYRNDTGSLLDSGAAFHNFYLGTLNWMDYDRDGDLDLLIGGNEAGTDLLRLYRNNTATANLPPSAPGDLAASMNGTTGEFSWSAASDDHTPAVALSYNLRVGTTPGGSQVVSAESRADGVRLVTARGNAQSNLFARVHGLVPGHTYYWSVQSVDGAFVGSAFAPEHSFTFAVEGVGGEAAAASALRATPNPFRGPTSLEYALPSPGTVRLGIYDASGRLVRTFELGAQAAGRHHLTWDGLDDAGRPVAGGVYFGKLEGTQYTTSRALVVRR